MALEKRNATTRLAYLDRPIPAAPTGRAMDPLLSADLRARSGNCPERPPSVQYADDDFHVGEFFMHVLSGSFANHVRDWDWRTWPRAHQVLTQIWPVKESMTVWPIRAANLTDADAYFIARAFFGWIDMIGRAATTGLIIRPVGAGG